MILIELFCLGLILLISSYVFWEVIERKFILPLVIKALRHKLFPPGSTTPVTIDQLKFRPIAGLIEAKGVRIGNPPDGEWKSPHAVSIRRLYIKTNGIAGFATLPGVLKIGQFRLGFTIRKVDVLEVDGLEVLFEEEIVEAKLNRYSGSEQDWEDFHPHATPAGKKKMKVTRITPVTNHGFVQFIKDVKSREKSLLRAEKTAFKRKWKKWATRDQDGNQDNNNYINNDNREREDSESDIDSDEFRDVYGTDEQTFKIYKIMLVLILNECELMYANLTPILC